MMPSSLKKRTRKSRYTPQRAVLIQIRNGVEAAMTMLKRIDISPTHELNGIRYCPGSVFPFGASLVEGGVQFSVFSRDASGCTLVLYHHGQPQPYAF